MRYNDKDYDGVLIQLPTFVVEANDLDKVLEAFAEVLEKCKYGTAHPAIQKSLNEIRERKDKKEFVRGKEESRKKDLQRSKEYNLKRLNKEILEIKFNRNFIEFENSEVMLNDNSSYKFTYTKKGNLDTNTLAFIVDYIKSLDTRGVYEFF